MTLIERGIKRGLIEFDPERKSIIYRNPVKEYRHRFTDPEEGVRVEAYIQLIEEYGYDPRRLVLEVPVKMGIDTKYADIIVYNDDAHKSPFIIVECKKPEVSDAAFGEAVNQAFSYANALSANFVWVTSSLKSEAYDAKSFYPMERERNAIADIPRFGKTVVRYRYTVGGQGGRALEVVDEDVLTRIFKQAHDALWAGGKRNPSQAFEDLDTLIFCKLWDERKDRDLGEPYDFQVYTGEDPDDLLKRVQALYQEGRNVDPEVFQEDIRLTARELQTVVGYLDRINLSDTDFDSKGHAFEEFMDSFFRGEFGQYFTPRPIVRFMIDVLPLTNQSKVLDTSCGSGGFLLYALQRIRQEAERRFKRGLITEERRYRHWHEFAEKRLFGIEISEMIARTAKMNMIIHDDGHTNVVAFDGLQTPSRIRTATRNDGFQENSFDFIVTNPPFGSKILTEERRYMEEYELGSKFTDWVDVKLRNTDSTTRDSQSSEVLFIEQCHRFLKAGIGILAIVVPDGILTNSSLQYVRDWVSEKYRILAVVSMPQTAFSFRGAGVKSSVLFLQKYTEAKTAQIRQAKERIQNTLFVQEAFGPQIQALEEEKKSAIKRGDPIIYQLEEELVAHLEALDDADNTTRRELQREIREKIKIHKRTDTYKEWQREITQQYNDRIAEVKEALSSTLNERVQSELENYPIFMAIAEDIGYDATGRPTSVNELETVSLELRRFIEAVKDGKDSFFFLTPNVDDNKLFLIHWRTLKNRIDPGMAKYRQQVLKFRYPTVELKNLLLSAPQYGANELGVERKSLEEPRYIRITDIDKYGQLRNDMGMTAAVVDNKYLLKNNDLLIARSGNTVGKTFLFKSELIDYVCFFAGYMIRFVLDETKIIPDYIFYYTQLSSYIGWVKAVQRAAGQPNINAEEYKSLLIPLPDKSLQQRIINIMGDAYAEKRRKEIKAQHLLDSIDVVVMDALGITLPSSRENTLAERMFYARFQAVVGGRFDPEIISYNQVVLDCAFPLFPLKTLLLKPPQYGANEAGIERKSYGEYRYIRITDIDETGELISELGVTAATIEDKYILNDGDLLIARSGNTVGKSYIHKTENVIYPCFYAGYMIRFVLNTELVDPNYVFYYLQTTPYKRWVNAIQRTTGQPNINAEEYKSLPIPVPPIPKQLEITEKVIDLRKSAKLLQQEAWMAVNNAKQQVEQMILGEAM